VQPFIRLDEFFACDNTLKNDPAFQEALRKRGITDFREAEERPLRLARALTWVRADSSEAVAR
jgi:primary-amine oxidase